MNHIEELFLSEIPPLLTTVFVYFSVVPDRRTAFDSDGRDHIETAHISALFYRYECLIQIGLLIELLVFGITHSASFPSIGFF